MCVCAVAGAVPTCSGKRVLRASYLQRRGGRESLTSLNGQTGPSASSVGSRL